MNFPRWSENDDVPLLREPGVVTPTKVRKSRGRTPNRPPPQPRKAKSVEPRCSEKCPIPKELIDTVRAAYPGDIDLYKDVLEVQDHETIRVAYFRRGRKVLQNTSPISSLEETQSSFLNFQALTAAYEILNYHEWKTYYDRYGFSDVAESVTSETSNTTPFTTDSILNRSSSWGPEKRKSKNRKLRWKEHVEELVFCRDDNTKKKKTKRALITDTPTDVETETVAIIEDLGKDFDDLSLSIRGLIRYATFDTEGDCVREETTTPVKASTITEEESPDLARELFKPPRRKIGHFFKPLKVPDKKAKKVPDKTPMRKLMEEKKSKKTAAKLESKKDASAVDFDPFGLMQETANNYAADLFTPVGDVLLPSIVPGGESVLTESKLNYFAPSKLCSFTDTVNQQSSDASARGSIPVEFQFAKSNEVTSSHSNGSVHRPVTTDNTSIMDLVSDFAKQAQEAATQTIRAVSPVPVAPRQTPKTAVATNTTDSAPKADDASMLNKLNSYVQTFASEMNEFGTQLSKANRVVFETLRLPEEDVGNVLKILENEMKQPPDAGELLERSFTL